MRSSYFKRCFTANFLCLILLCLHSCDAVLWFRSAVPERMKAARVSSFGDAKNVLSVTGGSTIPVLVPRSGKILVKVKACSLSPSDYRTMSGDCDLIKRPVEFPYTPGGDISGIVEQVDPGEQSFKRGDRIVATWSMFGEGGLAEYAVVDTKLAALMPSGVSFTEGASLANSATYAEYWCKAAKLKKTDRVLVLGGSGGVGTILVQRVKAAGAYCASTSTNAKLLRGLGVDKVIDYRTEHWWDAPEPYDVIFDCAVGVAAWEVAVTTGILKTAWQGGRFVAFVLNRWHIEAHSWWAVADLLLRPLARQLWSRCCPLLLPKYKMVLGPDVDGASIARILELAARAELKAVLDPAGPFPFSTRGIRRAFELHSARRARGKVVVKIP